MKNKSCTACGIQKDYSEYDADDHDMSGVMAKCKECCGTLAPKPKRRRSKRVRKPEQAVEPITINDMDVVEDVPYFPTVESGI